MDIQGQYFVKHPFIAMREDYGQTWRISRITINPDTSLTLTYLETAYDKMEAEQVMDKANESDNKDDGFESDEIATNNYGSNRDDVIRPLYYV